MNDLINESKKWISERPFLDQIGGLYLAIYEILGELERPPTGNPDLSSIKEVTKKGEPAIKVGVFKFLDFDYLGQVFKALTNLSENENLPLKFREECRILSEFLEKEPQIAAEIVKNTVWEDANDGKPLVIDEKVSAPLVNFFAWVSFRHGLKPYLKSLEEVEKGWIHGDCPTCGEKPVMGFLKRTGRGRERFLSCCHCGTSWSYKRVGCPYCGNSDPKTLGVIDVEEEGDIRIDVCNNCDSYIKTYVDKGKTGAAYEDWASVHIDMLFKDKKYKKHGNLLIAE